MHDTVGVSVCDKRERNVIECAGVRSEMKCSSHVRSDCNAHLIKLKSHNSLHCVVLCNILAGLIMFKSINNKDRFIAYSKSKTEMQNSNSARLISRLPDRAESTVSEVVKVEEAT